jgi:RNA polymerase sigma-70 factor (ECF subfamily)
MPGQSEFEGLVNQHYAALYRFALSLAGQEADACDLTQQAFYIWARKGHQLKDPAKAKSWLFTTLHREFLLRQRRLTRFPHQPLETVDLPLCDPQVARHLDGAAVVQALVRLDEPFRAPLALFYLEDYSYQGIADVLRIPLGTVKSRIARGLAQLQKLLHRQPVAHPTAKEHP